MWILVSSFIVYIMDYEFYLLMISVLLYFIIINDIMNR